MLKTIRFTSRLEAGDLHKQIGGRRCSQVDWGQEIFISRLEAGDLHNRLGAGDLHK